MYQVILIIEDNEDDVVLLCHEMKQAKLHNPIRICGDGECAIRYLAGSGEFADREKHPLPALILLDLKLPRRSGSEVLAWLEGHPELHTIPIFAVTGQTDPKHLAQVSHLGVGHNILTKPVRGEILLSSLKRVNEFRWKKTPEGEALELFIDQS